MIKSLKANMFLIVVLISAIYSPTSFSFEISKCDLVAKSDLADAASFIDQNLNELANSFTHLNNNQREEFKKKWAKVKIVCKDDGPTTRCTKKSSVGGFAHGGIGNRIRVCYYNMVDLSLSSCDLVDILAHEMGHANGYPSMNGHNNPDSNIRSNDNMYVMGIKASTLCDTKVSNGTFTDSPLKGVSQRGINDSCSKDDQCASGKCAQGACRCKEDSDCSFSEQCYKPIGKMNYCESTTKALGLSCNKNSQCKSDKCEQGACVCNSNNDCSNGESCFKPISSKNYCESTTKALGLSCNKNSQCNSDKCEQGACVCNSDSDCSNGESCFKPATKKNYCESTTKALGQSCKKNSQCNSDKCEQGACVCNSDNDCSNGESCFKPATKKNYCESTTKALGKSCKKNSQCKSNKCEKDECVCKSDSDCSGGKKCSTPITKKNYCS